MAKRIAVINGMGEVTEPSPGDFQTTGMLDAGVMQFTSSFLSNAGVDDIAGGSLEVSATSPASADVEVSAGSAYVENDAYTVGGDEVKFWHVSSDDTEVVTIPANTSGNPRIDLICVEVDPLQTPGADGSANIDFVVVQGTPAGSPTPPAVPAKHLVLAQIAVADSFSSITSGNITDRRVAPLVNGELVGAGWTPANERWSYVSVDDPIGIIEISGDQTAKYSAGMRIRFVNNANTIYGIIQVVALNSGNTRITFLHEIDPTDSLALYLMQNSAITNPVYSWHKAPFGFPLKRSSWRVYFKDSLDRQINSAVVGTYYNLGTSLLDVPIGGWVVGYNVVADAESLPNNNTNIRNQVTLSTANNSESDKDLTTNYQVGGSSQPLRIAMSLDREKELILTTKTRYYLNAVVIVGSIGTLGFRGDRAPTLIYADNIYR